MQNFEAHLEGCLISAGGSRGWRSGEGRAKRQIWSTSSGAVHGGEGGPINVVKAEGRGVEPTKNLRGGEKASPLETRRERKNSKRVRGTNRGQGRFTNSLC